jgi:uncharacterized membrane protein YsdA (DUF1294 family)/cold shock CspA family protein
MQKTGKVLRWDADKGFGFIRSPDTDVDVFFHVRDVQGGLSPEPGASVVFEEIHVGGKGPRAMAVRALGSHARTRSPRQVPRPGATKPARRPGEATSTGVGRRTGGARGVRPDPWLQPILLLAVACALVLLWAADKALLPWGVLWMWPLLNVLTLWLYWQDKHAARQGAWRISESKLHMLSLLGAWPAARVAQQMLRHKSSKASFQQGYVATVLINVSALLGYVYWRYALV